MEAAVSALRCMPLLGRTCNISLNLFFCTMPNGFWYCRTVLITFIPLQSYRFEIFLNLSLRWRKCQLVLKLSPQSPVPYSYDTMLLSALRITQECLKSG